MAGTFVLPRKLVQPGRRSYAAGLGSRHQRYAVAVYDIISKSNYFKQTYLQPYMLLYFVQTDSNKINKKKIHKQTWIWMYIRIYNAIQLHQLRVCIRQQSKKNYFVKHYYCRILDRSYTQQYGERQSVPLPIKIPNLYKNQLEFHCYLQSLFDFLSTTSWLAKFFDHSQKYVQRKINNWTIDYMYAYIYIYIYVYSYIYSIL